MFCSQFANGASVQVHIEETAEEIFIQVLQLNIALFGHDCTTDELTRDLFA